MSQELRQTDRRSGSGSQSESGVGRRGETQEGDASCVCVGATRATDEELNFVSFACRHLYPRDTITYPWRATTEHG